MGRYYGHRITKRERAAVNTLYAPRIFTRNECNAFSHSAQCDQFFSVKSDTIGGVEHVRCLCWCHRAITLYGQPEPEYDLSPPPEYANSADLAFLETEPARMGKPVTLSDCEIFASDSAAMEQPLYDPILPLQSDRFPSRSHQELAKGKCDTCGDALVACECVE